MLLCTPQKYKNNKERWAEEINIWAHRQMMDFPYFVYFILFISRFKEVHMKPELPKKEPQLHTQRNKTKLTTRDNRSTSTVAV